MRLKKHFSKTVVFICTGYGILLTPNSFANDFIVSAADNLSCDLSTQSIICENRNDCNKYQEFLCDIFISSVNTAKCLGIENLSQDPGRNVTVVPCNALKDTDHIVWAWHRRNKILHPLSNLDLCLTDLGWNNRKRAFNAQSCQKQKNQTWAYYPETQVIVNTTSRPIAEKTLALDRYAQMITWGYNSKSHKQTWFTASQIIKEIQNSGLQGQPLQYPVKLISRSKWVLDPPSVLLDRYKFAINNIFSDLGALPYERDTSKFPGTVFENAPLVTKDITFNLLHTKRAPNNRRVDQWISTGLYAVPGKPLKILTTDNSNLYVRVGSHNLLTVFNDNIRKDKVYKRNPILSIRKHLSNHTENTLVSDTGGLIYLENNDARDQNVTVTISGATPALIFDGTQTQQDWETLCQMRTPFGEIIGKYAIVSEGGDELCKLSVTQLNIIRNYYDQMVQDHEKLAGFDNSHLLHQQLYNIHHRFVYDIQTTAGYGHAGHPIMAMWHMVADHLHNIDIWGNGHELGHNYQNSCFWKRFGVEVTCNLFTVHNLESLYASGYYTKPYGHFNDFDRIKAQYANNTLSYDSEDTTLFMQLGFLLQIKSVTGWEPFTKLYQSYRLFSDHQTVSICENPQSQLDYVYIALSKFSGIDLTDHFRTWRLPISIAAIKSVKKMHLSKPDIPISSIDYRDTIVIKPLRY